MGWQNYIIVNLWGIIGTLLGLVNLGLLYYNFFSRRGKLHIHVKGVCGLLGEIVAGDFFQCDPVGAALREKKEKEFYINLFFSNTSNKSIFITQIKIEARMEDNKFIIIQLPLAGMRKTVMGDCCMLENSKHSTGCLEIKPGESLEREFTLILSNKSFVYRNVYKFENYTAILKVVTNSGYEYKEILL